MNQPVRVLHAVVNMNRGGAETFIMNLYRNIDRSKVQFDFLTCKEGMFDEEIRSLGGEIHRIPYISDVGHYRYIKGLRHFFKNHSHYRIIHSHMDKISGFILYEAKRAGIPMRIAHCHSTRSEGGYAAKAYKWIAGKYILPNATELMACSKAAAAWLFQKKEIYANILNNGIDCEQFTFSQETRNSMRDKLNLKPEDFVVGHVGRFSPPKNHSFLIDVYFQVVKKKPNSVLLLVGEGPLKKEVEKKVNAMNISANVRFLGIRSDVSHLLQAMDVMVFPSVYEGLPVTLIEAQASGLPCVVSNSITNEVDMGAGILRSEKLHKTPLEWADTVLQPFQIRHNATDVIRKQGFDIRQSSAWLQGFYTQKKAIVNP